jgi:hypothetical protein
MSEPLVLRPRRLVRTAWAVAVVVLGAFAGIGALLRTAPPGQVQFQLADQVAITVLGLLGAAAILLFTRFRVVADASGVRVRNVLGEKSVPWAVVRGVRLDEHASWASLDLQDDEVLPLLAVQANDGRQAVEAVERLQALLRASRGLP